MIGRVSNLLLTAAMVVGASASMRAASSFAAVRATAPAPLAYGEPNTEPARPTTSKDKPSAPKSPHRHRGRAAKAARRTSVLHDAEIRSTEVPHAPEFVNAALHYTYEPGKLYKVETAVGFLTAIALRPGERLISKAAGDTAHWEVGETSEGAAVSAHVVLLIKPLDAHVRTNMILTTDQRTYVLDLMSADGSDHVTFVDWRYPADDLRDLQVQRAAATVEALAAQNARLQASPFITPPGAQSPVAPPRLAGPTGLNRPAQASEIAPAALDFNYRIEPLRRRAPGWTPEHVFDDGHKTYVKFPADIATKEIPPLFVIGSRGEAELVNYRFDSGYYVVQRLFSLAELRIGTKDQEIVRITYKGAAR
jgi:type IV secretion system protein VirB9